MNTGGKYKHSEKDWRNKDKKYEFKISQKDRKTSPVCEWLLSGVVLRYAFKHVFYQNTQVLMNALGGYLGFNILPKAFLSCKLEIKALTIELVDNLLYVPGHRLPLRFWLLLVHPE